MIFSLFINAKFQCTERLLEIEPGVGVGLKKSVPGYARLHKNVTKAGSRLRWGYTKTLPKSILGYTFT